MVKVMISFGFEGTYNLVHMPVRSFHHKQRRPSNLGYAFVNFKSPKYAFESVWV